MADNQHKRICFRASKVTPRDGWGTQNRQKSATDGAARAESSGLELCRVVTEENEVKYDCRIDQSYRLLFLLVGNRISIYRFLCLLFASKFDKNANLEIKIYKIV